MDRLGQKGINVRASSGLTSVGNRYGLILWVAPADVEAATRALGASVAVHHRALTRHSLDHELPNVRQRRAGRGR